MLPLGGAKLACTPPGSAASFSLRAPRACALLLLAGSPEEEASLVAIVLGLGPSDTTLTGTGQATMLHATEPHQLHHSPHAALWALPSQEQCPVLPLAGALAELLVMLEHEQDARTLQAALSDWASTYQVCVRCVLQRQGCLQAVGPLAVHVPHAPAQCTCALPAGGAG